MHNKEIPVNRNAKWFMIFDMDGCLIDSEGVQKKAFYGSYQEIVGDDKCPDFSEYAKHTGDSLLNIFNKMGLPTEMIAPYRRISSEAIEEIVVNKNLIDFLRSLKDQGVECSICTGKDHKRTVDILKFYDILDVFPVVVASDDVPEPKPSPMPLLKCMELLGENSKLDNTLFVGDGYNDILAASNAGLKSVLALWYTHCDVPINADYKVESLDDFETIVRSLLNEKK